MKKCSTCKNEKPLEDFSLKSKAKGTRMAICKECHRDYAKKHYSNNKTYYLDKSKRSGKTYYERNKKFIIEHLQNNPCVDCGEKDLDVLEFDHRELVGSKGLRINSFLKGSLEALMKELDKCDVRCSNCHTRRTRKQLGWLR